MQETIKSDTTEQQETPARMDVRHEVAQKIIEAMKLGETPWQKPWSVQAMKPYNGVTDHAYVLSNLTGKRCLDNSGR